MKKLGLLATVIAAIAFSAAPALAQINQTKQTTQINDDTTIIFDSSFKNTNYTEGQPVQMLVDWEVDAGFATFQSVALRDALESFGPKGVVGSLTFVNLTDQSGAVNNDGRVEVTVTFTDLKCRKSGIGKGNVKLKLFLNVDTDGVDGTDTVIGHGFNLKVRDPSGGACP